MQSNQDSQQPNQNISVGKGMGCLVGIAGMSVGFILSFVFLLIPGIGPLAFFGGIVGSLIFPFWINGIGPFKRNYFKDKCPYCGAILIIEAKNEINGINCNICLKRIVVKNNKLTKIE